MTAALQGSLMVDVAGTWLTAEDRHLLRQPEVGGLIIFARNIEHPRQVRELSAAIRAVRPDLLLAVDQEGGRVQRLRQGFVRLPAMRALADNPNAEYLAEQCGWIMATEVLAVGLDLSFAPVLDLDYQRSAVVGTRSFEGDPERAAVLAGAFIRGMNNAGMAGAPKAQPDTLLAGLELLGKLDTRAALQRFNGPQLHLFAGLDALVPVQAASDVLALLPDVEVGLIEQACHAFLLEAPHELAAAIQVFLHESGDE